MKDFTAKMQKLSNSQIVELIDMTWNDSCGVLFREAGFDILEERLGEDESDRIYSEIWNRHHK